MKEKARRSNARPDCSFAPRDSEVVALDFDDGLAMLDNGAELIACRNELQCSLTSRSFRRVNLGGCGFEPGQGLFG